MLNKFRTWRLERRVSKKLDNLISLRALITNVGLLDEQLRGQGTGGYQIQQNLQYLTSREPVYQARYQKALDAFMRHTSS